MNDIILDRSRLEGYAECPQQGHLSRCFEIIKAKGRGLAVTEEEEQYVASMKPEIRQSMAAIVLQGDETFYQTSGTLIHKLIEQAFEECENDLSRIPDWFVEKLPSIRPDVQPDAIRAARHVADKLADMHTRLIGTEVQIDLCFLPSTSSRGRVILTARLDVLSQGNSALHVWDWKTGFKKRTSQEAFDSFQGQFIAYLLWQQPEYREIDVIHFFYQETRWGLSAYARYERTYEHPRMPHLTMEAAFKGRIAEAVRLYMEDCRECWPEPKKCLWCDYIRWCDLAHRDAKEIADNPKEFIDKLVVDQASVDRRFDAATAWLKAKGPIVGTAVVFDRKKPTQRFTAEVRRIKQGKYDSQVDTTPIFQPTGDEEIDAHFA